MKKLFRIIFSSVAAIIALIVLFLVGFQILQAIDDRKHPGGASGIVLDQDGNPMSGVEVVFRSWNWRMYVPIPFAPTRIVEKTTRTTTNAKGMYSVAGSYPRTDFVSISKAGYRQDGPETDYMWHPYDSLKSGSWDFHLVSEALMRQDQIKDMEFSSVPFFQNGRIGLNLVDGTISDSTNADVVFEWRHLAATTSHGNYGRFTILAPEGGVWFWEQDRFFAPAEGYEQGMIFFFGIEFFGGKSFSYNTYPYRRRTEFYVKSRNGQVYARLYAELNTADQTLSLRTRVNASRNRFIDAKGGAYVMGVYGSMSENYLNPGVPWWISMDPVRSQVIMTDERLRMMATNFTAYFAGHYQTPPDVLELMTSSNFINDHYIPQNLARNYSAPTNVLNKLIKIDPNGNRWFGKDARSVLNAPEDIKDFLINKDN